MTFTAITLFLFLFFTKGIRVILSGHAQKLYELLPLFIMAIIGYIFAFIKPRWGAVILIIAGSGLFLYYLLTRDLIFIVLIFGVPFFISGILLWAVYAGNNRH